MGHASVILIGLVFRICHYLYHLETILIGVAYQYMRIKVFSGIRKSEIHITNKFEVSMTDITVFVTEISLIFGCKTILCLADRSS